MPLDAAYNSRLRVNCGESYKSNQCELHEKTGQPSVSVRCDTRDHFSSCSSLVFFLFQMLLHLFVPAWEPAEMIAFCYSGHLFENTV